MINGKQWFAFFSHTGTEIANISKRLGVVPDCIITNNDPGNKNINKDVLKLKSEIKFVREHPTVADYNTILQGCDFGCICTLHGWMKIIPKSVCKNYEMYNLHPGLITKYPELKGKDPQNRVNSEDHKEIGVVIHSVIPEVDEGEILVEKSCMNCYSSPRAIYTRLHDMATSAWVTFFERVLLHEDS